MASQVKKLFEDGSCNSKKKKKLSEGKTHLAGKNYSRSTIGRDNAKVERKW
jgi:hypothetical protein